MNIGKRYEEEHVHNDEAKICVMSHKRDINDKTFLFTQVSTVTGSRCAAYRQDIVINRIHSAHFSHVKETV